MDIDRLQSVGLVIIRPISTQSDRKSDLLKIFRPESVKILKKGRQNAGDLFVYKKNVKKRSKCEVFHYKSL